MEDKKIVCISGYFDPLHVGHIDYMRKARELGDYLVVIVNNDHQARLKKNAPFMPENERIEVVASLRYIDKVVKSIDNDRSVCKTLQSIVPKPHVFCNGGDQNNQNIPEAKICNELSIQLVDGLGDKVQSSSWLIEKGKNIKKN